MQATGHLAVGSDEDRHTDVQDMYVQFFSGDAVNIKRALKGELGPIKAKAVLSQIFQVYYCMN